MALEENDVERTGLSKYLLYIPINQNGKRVSLMAHTYTMQLVHVSFFSAQRAVSVWSLSRLHRAAERVEAALH